MGIAGVALEGKRGASKGGILAHSGSEVPVEARHQIRRARIADAPLRDHLRRTARADERPAQPDYPFPVSDLASAAVAGGEDHHLGVEFEVVDLTRRQEAVLAAVFV